MEIKGGASVKTQDLDKFFGVVRGFPSKRSLLTILSATEEVYRRRKRSRTIWAYAFSIWLLAFVSIPVRAQVLYGSVVGAVTDSSGAAVPGAAVQITDILTNDHRTAQTDNGGAYTISTAPVGTYQVNISKQGFRTFQATNVQVIANNVTRVNAQLQVGAVTQTVSISAAAGALLQTDTADVHAEIPAETLETMPQPTYTYEGLIELSPGVTPPAGQLSGGTNNPSKSETFAANGTGDTGTRVRIEGVSANLPWGHSGSNQGFVPSTEAIDSVNVVTNSPSAEQGLAGGASVTVTLKSGTNTLHGALYEYNINNATEARNFFQPVGQAAPHLVDNDVGGWLGGPIIRDKLFYWGGYEGDFTRQGMNGIIAVPTPTMLSGDLSGSPTPIYDPNTGNPDGSGRTPFRGNIIPQNRISPVVQKLLPDFPTPNLPGIVNNLETTQATTYNLHKISAKIDYQATSKLRISGRWAYQPYYNINNPLYGPILGGASDGWAAFAEAQAGNYLQHGATLAISSSATYVFSPSLVADFTFGVTQAHQLLFPTEANVLYGLDVLGIPGTNVGGLPWAGGMPQFTIGSGDYGGPTFGESYPPLEYKDPVFEYNGNVTKVLGSHNLRFGADIIRPHWNHEENEGQGFNFTGGLTALNDPNAPPPNDYNAVADFLLGLPQNDSTSFAFQEVQLREWEMAFYAQDEWQINPKWTLSYGLRWEHYPVPTSPNHGYSFNNLVSDPNNNTYEICGEKGIPSNCGIQVSSKLFGPTLGIDYRMTKNLVARAGYSLSPLQTSMALLMVLNYPSLINASYSGDNAYVGAGSLTTGVPISPAPDISQGTLSIPPGVEVDTNTKNYKRGYVQSYNLMLEQRLPAGLALSVGYVGTRVTNNYQERDINYGQLGGGTPSQPFYKFGDTTPVAASSGATNDMYNSLQETLIKRFSNGISLDEAYTWQKDMQDGFTQPGVAIPQYIYLNKSVTPIDRKNNFTASFEYRLPFGNDQRFLSHGIGAALAGGWSLNGVFDHYSGLPFTVTASGASCECPGSNQRAEQVKAKVAKVGDGLNGNAYFDPSAFASVTTATFGNVGYDSLRGPGSTNLDGGVFRDFHIWERLGMQFRVQALNVTNTPHFGNPGSDVSSVSYESDGTTIQPGGLNGFSQINSLAPLGRLIDPRYFRFGARFSF